VEAIVGIKEKHICTRKEKEGTTSLTKSRRNHERACDDKEMEGNYELIIEWRSIHCHNKF